MADPDLQISGGGGGEGVAVIQTLRWGGRGGRALGPHFGLKIRGGWAPRAPPLDPPLKLGEVMTMLLIP